MQNFLNVIIPVKDRYDTLYYTIKNVLSDNYKNLKVIISDNSLIKNKKFYENFNDERLIVIYTPNDLEMHENYEFALDIIDNGWLGYIGSDDGFIPGSLEFLNNLINIYKDENVIRFSPNYYIWPSIKCKNGIIKYNLKNRIELRNSKKYLQKVINGYLSYDELPLIYNGGFVKYDYLKKLYRNGRFFQSKTPDLYSGIAISMNTNNYIYVNKPLFFYGSSVHSSGNSLHKTTGKLDINTGAYEFFKKGNWHKNCPIFINNVPIRSLYIYVIESYFVASEIFNRKLSKNTFTKLYITCMSLNNNDKKNVYRWGDLFKKINNIDSIRNETIKIYFFKFILFSFKIIYFLRKKIRRVQSSKLNNIYEAMVFLKNEKNILF